MARVVVLVKSGSEDSLDPLCVWIPRWPPSPPSLFVHPWEEASHTMVVSLKLKMNIPNIFPAKHLSHIVLISRNIKSTSCF